MERAISPSPSISSAANPNPQRSLVAERRTSYRLFPIVDQTPPASPVTLQKATLSKAAGNHRRRSSSLDHNQRHERSGPSAGHARLLTSALRLRDSNANNIRKGSLPDIRPLGDAREKNSDVSAKLHGLPPRPHTAVDRAFEEGSVDARSNSVTGDPSVGDCHQVPSRLAQYGENRAVVARGLGSHIQPTPALRQGRRVRSKPNLRINIAAEQDSTERPPPPPPKSPRHARDASGETQRQHSTSERRHATTTAHVRDDSDPAPSTPAVAQQQSLVSLSPTLKVREFTVSPVARGRAVRKEIPTKMHELLPSDFLDEKTQSAVPALQPPSSKFSDPSVRPSTSEGLNVSNGWTGNAVPPPSREPPRPPESRSSSNSRWSRMMKSSSRSGSRQDHDTRPISPEVRPLASHPVKSDWSELPTFASRPVRRSITPEPQIARDDSDTSRALNSKGHHTLGSRSKSSINLRQTSTDYMPPESLSKASLALATARANVAALRNSNASAGSPESGRRSRSSGSDIGDGLPRRPNSPGASDPIETLKELSEQVESLHTRYAGLKAERQKISSSIIASLKDPKFGPESANLILDEQLSLAAVSSSIDICFAKLKSLECRKEDAIAALIARTTQSQRNPTDNISAMIASMALTRKASLAPSTDSGSRFAPTGRSTPDLGDNSSLNHRLTQPSTRTFSYGSEPESFDYRNSSLSRKHSNGGDSLIYTDGFERQTPATIPEDSENSPRSQRVSRIHDSASVLDQRTSDVSALSPVFESHQRASLSEAALEAVIDSGEADGSSDTLEATAPEPSPTSERSMSPEDLLDEQQPKRILVKGSKAAKILGLLGKTTKGEDSPLIKLPTNDKETKKPAAVKVTEVELELHRDDTTASLLSVHTGDDSILTADTQASSANLEDQLKSFPKPSPNLSDSRRDTGGSFLTNGSSAESSCEPDEPEPPLVTRRDAGGKGAVVRKRDPSAHTIQVYLERDEILEYYDRLRR